MRYHKATSITRPEAHAIIASLSLSLNEYVVIEHLDQWFDVRRMTDKEVEDFVDDLIRSSDADVAAGFIIPH
jgi:hypothetical protein